MVSSMLSFTHDERHSAGYWEHQLGSLKNLWIPSPLMNVTVYWVTAFPTISFTPNERHSVGCWEHRLGSLKNLWIPSPSMNVTSDSISLRLRLINVTTRVGCFGSFRVTGLAKSPFTSDERHTFCCSKSTHPEWRSLESVAKHRLP